jgi:signal transduction histidine kinase
MERFEVEAPAFADAFTHLPALLPCAASLAALARAPAGAWDQIRLDPGGVLLLTAGGDAAVSPADSLAAAPVRSPAVLDRALLLLGAPGAAFVDWGRPTPAAVYRAALTYARLARLLAEKTVRCDPDAAWAAGLLAPLGWLAACAACPEQVSACLTDPELPVDPEAVQIRRWGLGHAALARRLARQWRLAPWLAAVVGQLDLPADLAEALGAEPCLFRTVQAAVALAPRAGQGLPLALGSATEEHAAALGMPVAQLDQFAQLAGDGHGGPPSAGPWQGPSEVPLLADLLRLAREARSHPNGEAVRRLEREQELAYRALRTRRAGEEARLRAQRLGALAEFAAGASHEINNPLAVISGHAQHLLAHEADETRRRSLQTIINQTRRVHDVLTALMKFARPARPQKKTVALADLVHEVADELSDLAAQRRVRLACTLPEQTVHCHADPRQLRLALACLVRNAVESAPAEGWTTVRLETPGADRVELVVEDNGPGPPPGECENLFDPFFSGRHAGRGRGLGLPIAWRLAQEHGGEVRYDRLPHGPTRFVLSLPRHAEPLAAVNGHVLS